MEVAAEWEALGKKASGEGTLLHAYGEDLLNKKEDIIIPDLEKAKWVPKIVDKVFKDAEKGGYTDKLILKTTTKMEVGKIKGFGGHKTMSQGVFKTGDDFTAMTFTESKSFKTKKGAQRWLEKRMKAYGR